MMRPLVTLLLLVAAPLSPYSQAQQLEGKLFTTPEQRTYLDALREEFLAASREAGFDIEESEIPPLPASDNPLQRIEYTLDGILTRRDGSHVIWLNNRSLADDELPDGVALVNEESRLALRFRTAIGDKLLFPGQTIELNSGLVRERYQRTDPPAATDADEAEQP